jgi:hypothetical protein
MAPATSAIGGADDDMGRREFVRGRDEASAKESPNRTYDAWVTASGIDAAASASHVSACVTR